MSADVSVPAEEHVVVHDVLEVPVSRKRRIVTGSVMIVVGLFCALLLGLGSKSGYDAGFQLSQAGAKVHVPTVTLPARLTCILLGLVVVALGVWQIARGFSKAAIRWVLTVTVAGRRRRLPVLGDDRPEGHHDRPDRPAAAVDLPGHAAHPRRDGRPALRALRRHQRRHRGPDADGRLVRRAVRHAGPQPRGRRHRGDGRGRPGRPAARGLLDPLPGQPGRPRRRPQPAGARPDRLPVRRADAAQPGHPQQPRLPVADQDPGPGRHPGRGAAAVRRQRHRLPDLRDHHRRSTSRCSAPAGGCAPARSASTPRRPTRSASTSCARATATSSWAASWPAWRGRR